MRSSLRFPSLPAFLRRLFSSAFLSVSATSLLAQPATTHRESASSTPPAQEDVVQLSPFTVSATQDTGYQATSTLAGTRLNTPVKDLGASISIYTKDFLTDIGATSSSDLLIYATGMEAAGAGGNFSGASGDVNAVQVNGDGPRVAVPPRPP